MYTKQYAITSEKFTAWHKPLQSTVVWQEHLECDLNSETHTAQLTVLSADAMGLGKSIVQIFAENDFSQINNITITVKTAVDLQILLMYLVAPPENFPKAFKSGDIRIQLQTPAAVANMISMLTTTDIGRAITLPEVFGKTKVSWELMGTKETLFHELERSCKAALRLFPQKESRAPIVAAFKDVATYLNTHDVTYIDQTPTRSTYPKLRSTIINPDYVAAVRRGEVLYASSDESLHMFKTGTALNIIDPGNLATPAYAREIIDKENIDRLNILLTHMHSDHMAALLSLLQQLNQAQVAYKVSIPDTLLYEFSGFFAAHREELAALNFSRHVQLIKQGDPLFTGDSRMLTFTKVTKSLRHFIPNASYGFLEKGHMRYFSGDINIPLAPPAAASAEDKRKYRRRIQYAFTTYFKNIFLAAKQSGATSLELFVDFGHFPPQWQAYMRATIERMAQHYDLQNYTLYEEHIKQTKGTTETATQRIPEIIDVEEIVNNLQRRYVAARQRQPVFQMQ